MKRIYAILLCLALLLSGCGGTAPSSAPPEGSAPETTEAAVEVAEDGYYTVPASWTEDSAMDEGWGYRTEAAPEYSQEAEFTRQGDYLVRHTADYSDPERKQEFLFQDLEGNEIGRAEITLDEPEGDTEEYIYSFCFTGTTLWTVLTRYTFRDREAGLVDTETLLQRRSPTGELLETIPFAGDLDLGEDTFVAGMTVSPNGELVLLSSDSSMLFWTKAASSWADGRRNRTSSTPSSRTGTAGAISTPSGRAPFISSTGRPGPWARSS